AQAVLDLLLSTAPRWETLEVRDQPFILSALAKLPADTLKQLRTVQLGGGSDGQSEPASAFLCAPLLREITLSIAPRTEDFPMPWAQLTHLTLTDPRLHICIGILVQCTSLVYAKIDAETDEETGISSSIEEVVTLPQLQTFFLSALGTQIAPCLQSLALPGLTKLMVRHYSSENLQWTSAASIVFPQFLRRSQSIQYFSLSFCDLNSRQLHDILLHLPSLTQLRLFSCEYCIDDFLLGALKYSPDVAVHLVPRLRKLELQSVDDSFTEDVLYSMICSRWWTADDLSTLAAPPPVAPWECMDLWRGDECYSPFSRSFQAKIKQLKAQGFQV
ncbi:hypothetical protein R3P38DRAFT_3617743, partial [Favolaschia claudopus]